MLPVTDSFTFDYFGTDLVYGRGCIDGLGSALADRDLDRALVVCGSNVGANEELMAPIRRGLGDRLAGVFDETTPEKRAETVYAGLDRLRELDPDVLIGVGGGSSLDTARQMSAFAADGRSLSTLRDAAREGDVAPIDTTGPCTPVLVVPTTFAGADVSSGGTIEVLSASASPTDDPVRLSGSVTPEAIFYDPDLFETTPTSALAGSAMNGFDKGIETIYSPGSTPITDATAVHGLQLLRDTFPRLTTGDADAMDRAVIGLILVQFRRRTSIVHAFGHGFARRYPVQQGVAHAVLVPHVLRYVLDHTDARRAVLARGLGVDTESSSDAEVAEAVVDRVVAVRDGLGLPTRLREIEAVDRDDFPAIAAYIYDGLSRLPEGLDPTVEEVEAVLDEAW